MPRNLHPDAALFAGEPPEDPISTGGKTSEEISAAPATDAFFIDLNRLLPWIGVALLGIYVVTALASAIPLKILDPIWINRVCGVMRGGISFPLEAMVLILLGAYLSAPSKEPRRITRLRRLCSWVALGFLLMIPLQSWATQKLMEQAIATQEQQLQPFSQALKNLYAANTEDSLLAAMQSIPGAPPNISGKFTDPVTKVRESLIRQVEPQVRQRQELLQVVKSDIRRDSTTTIVKDGIVALFGAIGFAALGRSRPERPTLLLGITQPGRLRHRVHDDVSRWIGEDEA